MRRTMLAGLALAVMVAGADAASAQERPRERPSAERQARMERRGPGERMELFKNIELTADQKAKLQEMRKQRPEGNRDAFKAQQEKLRAAREARDTAQLRQLRTEMMKQAQEQQQRQFAEIRSILTEPQRAQFDKNVAEMRERMEKRRLERGPRGEGGEHRGHGSKPKGAVR